MYRALFNVPAANELAQGRLAGLDADNAHAVSMGNLEVESGSVNGRAATGTAFTAEAIRIREERKKQDAALIATIQRLSETLKRMDERIQKLNDEIKQLTELRDAEEARSKAAFDKMHDLEIRQGNAVYRCNLLQNSPLKPLPFAASCTKKRLFAPIFGFGV